MQNGLKLAVFAVLCAGQASMAMAGEVKRTTTADGIHVAYYPNSGRYCLRTSSEKQANRLALQLHSTECATAEHWANQGVMIARRGEQETQLASTAK